MVICHDGNMTTTWHTTAYDMKDEPGLDGRSSLPSTMKDPPCARQCIAKHMNIDKLRHSPTCYLRRQVAPYG